MLRDYQQRSIDDLYSWFQKNNTGNPCLVLPTGAGKSHVVAYLCKDALQNWPETRVLMLTHQKELIEQNAEKMRLHWPGAPLGIYSASIGRRDLDEPITFAGIQSVRDKAEGIGWVDLIIVDECHLINHKEEGGYRKLIGDLKNINPDLRVIGLTATPFRLGHGYIHDGDDTLFTDIIEPVTIEELLHKGFLAPLRSKVTSTLLSTDGVKKRGGEYAAGDLQRAVDTDEQNYKVVDESIRLAGDRKAWLFFCAGVEHAQHIADILNEMGIKAACVTGATKKADRIKILDQFRSGEIRAVTNYSVLSTGFDYPDIDFIGLLRPTMSPALYIQMAGRGLRPKSHTDHCLVADFAGCVRQHGPITAVNPPKKKGEKGGESPVKLCEQCSEILHASAKVCHACGFEFPVQEKKFKLHTDDIMGIEAQEMIVTKWNWQKHISRTSGKEMLKVTYYGNLSDPPIQEYLPVLHGGYAAQKALRTLLEISHKAAVRVPPDSDDLDAVSDVMNGGDKPGMIKYRQDGKFYRVVERQWL